MGKSVVCIAIVSETYVVVGSAYVMGRKRLGECKHKMKEIENCLYECDLGHRRYFPFDASELKSKIHTHTKDGEVYLK